MTDPVQTDFNIPDLPPPADSCPISELLGKRITQMDDNELAAHVRELRSAVESPQSMKKLLISSKASKPKAKAKVKVDMSLFGL